MLQNAELQQQLSLSEELRDAQELRLHAAQHELQQVNASMGDGGRSFDTSSSGAESKFGQFKHGR